VATILEKLNRNVIPRWRDFATTIELGELNSASSTRSSKPLLFELDSLEHDWKNRGTISFAGDLISAASISGNAEIAREAAEFVLATQGPTLPGHPLTLLAKGILASSRRRSESIAIPLESKSNEISARIASHRKRLADWPRDGILWVDLALLYAMQGVLDKAKRAMTVAMTLEPLNRFVLRSAARLFIHLNDPDRAHAILKKSPSVKYDPWIISAEIATATASNRVSISIDQGIRILASNRFDLSDTTELSTAIGTLEFQSGRITRAKRHIRQGLLKPNENSLAQAKWLSREIAGLSIAPSVTDFNVARSFEAATWEALAKGEWTKSGASAVSWFRDQPFSSRPAQLSGHIAAALLNDYSSAENLAKLGLLANPNDAKLRILLAFTYGSMGRTAEAREQLGLIKGVPTDLNEITILANHGLIEFRENQIENGRLLYSEAVRRAEIINNEIFASAALSYWAREEVRAKTPAAAAILARASESVKKLGKLAVEAQFIIGRIEKEYAEAHSND
jgi:tetratricopeptide (TPR) repeat protein